METYFLFSDYAFFELKKTKFLQYVRKENTKVYNFYKRMGGKVTHEDEEHYYLCCDIEAYKESREKYKRYVPEKNIKTYVIN